MSWSLFLSYPLFLDGFPIPFLLASVCFLVCAGTKAGLQALRYNNLTHMILLSFECHFPLYLEVYSQSISHVLSHVILATKPLYIQRFYSNCPQWTAYVTFCIILNSWSRWRVFLESTDNSVSSVAENRWVGLEFVSLQMDFHGKSSKIDLF